MMIKNMQLGDINRNKNLSSSRKRNFAVIYSCLLQRNTHEFVKKVFCLQKQFAKGNNNNTYR